MNVNLYSFSHTLLIHNHNTELLILLLMGPRLGIKTKGKGTTFNSIVYLYILYTLYTFY